MRLFAALPLPPATAKAIAQVQESLRDTNWPVRWVAPESLHVTLQFLGNVDEALAAPLAQALDRAGAGEHPIPLGVRAIEAVPNPRRCRILWVGLDAPPALEFLADRFARECLQLGIAGDEQAFRPHVTFGRMKDGGRLPEGALRRLEGLTLPEPFVADSLVLYESELGGGPARYVARHTHRLGSRA